MLEITNITNEKIDAKPLQKAAKAAFAVLARRSSAKRNEGGGEESISLVFTCDARMRGINKKFRGQDKTTDVLSFEELNEIYICLPQAWRQAKADKIPIEEELMRLLIHGIVHLKGYDHERSVKEAERMFAVEKKILKKLNGR